MIVRKIALNGWRNYEFAAAEFSPGTNVITGENAQGKTNLLEAVYLLTGGKSFRTRFDKELIGFGYTGAEVLADVFAFGREQTVRIVLRQGQRKQIWQNGVKKTAAELAGTFAAVLFCPDDLNIIRDGPAARRRMMDMAISQLRPKYGALLAEYSRLYDQKSAILRDWHEKPSLLDTLDDFSDQMCRVSARAHPLPRGLCLAAEHRGRAHPRRLFRRARQIDPRLPHGQHCCRCARHGKRDLLRPAATIRSSTAAPSSTAASA